MLDQLTFTGRELLLAVVLATLVYLLEIWLFSRRSKGAARTELDKHMYELEKRISLLEKQVGACLEQSAELMPDIAFDAHAEAMRLVREGMSAQEVADRLNISLSEAELIIALMRAKS